MAKTEKSPRGKKGEGPMTISYLDDTGNISKRVTDKTVAVRVSDKSDHVADYALDQLSPVIRNQLVAMALAKRIDTYVRNSVSEDGSNVIELAAGVYDGIKQGAIYTRKEGSGAGAGRPFDTSFWRGVMSDTAKIKKVTVTDKQLDSFETKLKSMTPADRKEHIAKLKLDKAFTLAWKKEIGRASCRERV